MNKIIIIIIAIIIIDNSIIIIRIQYILYELNSGPGRRVAGLHAELQAGRPDHEAVYNTI